jgi:NADH-quinone oxidoreductase subunit J
VNPTQLLILVLAGVGAVGLWLSLPGTRGRARAAGGVLLIVAGLLLTGVVQFGLRLERAETGLLGSGVVVAGPSFQSHFGNWTADLTFVVLAATGLAAAVGAITVRSPVYCAILFALTLLSVSALLMFQGAEFLGIATVVVYAGAILVTFLFVIMLSRPRGDATYDKLGWEAFLAAFASMALAGLVLSTLFGVVVEPTATPAATPADPAPNTAATADAGFLVPASRRVARQDAASTEAGPTEAGPTEAEPTEAAAPATASGIRSRLGDEARANDLLHDEHMARVGANLFGRHLVAVQAAGALLLVALSGAVAMVSHSRGTR